jgi:hypothetical protein
MSAENALLVVKATRKSAGWRGEVRILQRETAWASTSANAARPASVALGVSANGLRPKQSKKEKHMKTPLENKSREERARQSAKHSAMCVWVVLAMGALILSGCAQYTAINQPKPFKPAASVVGAERSTVICELGQPVVSTERNDRLRDTYKYIDGGSGNGGASKTLRVILYTGGDLFTLWLDQLLTWPFETYTFGGTEHVVTVDYVKGSDSFWWAKEVRDVESGQKQPAPKKAETVTASETTACSPGTVTNQVPANP